MRIIYILFCHGASTYATFFNLNFRQNAVELTVLLVNFLSGIQSHPEFFFFFFYE